MVPPLLRVMEKESAARPLTEPWSASAGEPRRAEKETACPAQPACYSLIDRSPAPGRVFVVLCNELYANACFPRRYET